MRQRGPRQAPREVHEDRARSKETEKLDHVVSSFGSVTWRLLGIICALFVSYWFYRNIGEVEREISMRTESGFYYSFYKHLVKAPSFSEALDALRDDERVEYPRRINSLRRFNIFQEEALAFLYRHLHGISILRRFLPDWFSQPILFYVYTCFLLSGLAVFSLFLLTWFLSGHWLCGLLTATWLTTSLDDTTRVFFTVNLRENFALPFFWMQTLGALVVLRRRDDRLPLALLQFALFFVCSFCFALFWQFNQFIFLLQSLALYGLSLLRPALSTRINCLLLCQTLSLLVGSDSEQKMTIGAFSISFNVMVVFVDCILRLLRRRPLSASPLIGLLITRASLTVVFSVLLNVVVKRSLQVDADTHIWSFVVAKLGLGAGTRPVSFETALYLCHGAFQSLDRGFFDRSLASGFLPLYALLLLVFVVSVLGEFFSKSPWSLLPAELVFLIAQSLVVGAVALFTLRIKYVWTPMIIVLAAFTLARAFSCIATRFLSRSNADVCCNAVLLVVIAVLIARYRPIYEEQMRNERVQSILLTVIVCIQEFYDPDTVALMDWINRHTQPHAVFTGSMQLLAGVHLCTGRYLTNHPHFEDRWLRDRTQRLYQIYGRREASDVAAILKAEHTDYIILEDSICLAHSDGCSTGDLVDLANGHQPDSGSSFKGLRRSNVPRFCDRVRHGEGDYAKYFRLVFSNNTFRVYQLLQ